MLGGVGLALLMLGASGPPSPEWSRPDLMMLFTQVDMAGRAPSPAAKDEGLANLAGAAYQVPRRSGETVDLYARRILLSREPTHPAILAGHWLEALLHKFYSDAGARACLLARFELDRSQRQGLEQRCAAAKKSAEILARQLPTAVEGMKGAMAPLPVAPGDKPTRVGAIASVRRGIVTLEEIDRVTFTDDAPPASAPRTPTGALRELTAAMKQYNMTAETLATVDRHLAAGRGILRIFIPAMTPSIYLNEIGHAAKEASMRTVFVMTTDPGGGLRQLPILVQRPRAGHLRSKHPKTDPVAVRCPDTAPIQTCVDQLLEGRKKGPVLLQIPEPGDGPTQAGREH